MKIFFYVFILIAVITSGYSQELKTLKGHNGNILTLAYSADGSYLVSGSSDNNIIVWNGEKGDLIKTIEPGRNDVQKIMFIGNSSQIVVGSNSDKVVSISLLGSKINHQTLNVWDIISGKELLGFEYFNDVYTFDLPSNNENIITLGVVDWEAEYYAGGKTAHVWQNYDLFNFNTKTKKVDIITIDKDDYDYEHGLKVDKSRKETGLQIKPLSFTSDGKYYAMANHEKSKKNSIIICETATNKIVNEIPSDKYFCNRIYFSPDGKYLAAISDYDESITIFSVEMKKRIKTIKAHEKKIYDIAFHPCLNFIASASKDETVKIWDINTGNLIKTLKGHTNDVRTIAFSPNGKILATGSDDETIKLWDLTVISPELKKFAMEYEANVGIVNSVNKEMEAEIKTLDDKFKPKGEFETSEAYNSRIVQANSEKQAIIDKYTKKLNDLKSEKKEEIEGFKNQVQDEKLKKIEESVKDTILHIEKIGNYNADNETFPITIAFTTSDVKIPLAEAVEFKNNYKKAVVKAKKKLNYNLTGWEYFDVLIINPKNNAEYIFK